MTLHQTIQSDYIRLLRPVVSHLLQLPLHAGHEHDAGHGHPQQHEEGIDEAGDGGVVPTGAAPAQQTGSTATQAGDLERELSGVRDKSKR